VTAREHNSAGIALAKAGRYREALESFRQALAADPRHVEAGYNFAKALKDCGRFEESIAAYRRTLSLNPDIAAAWNNLGNLLKALGRLDEAIDAYAQVLRVEPNDVAAMCNFGAGLQEKGHVDRAVEMYQRALSLQPEFPLASRNLGTALYELGQPREAAGHFRRAVSLQPDFVEAWHGLGTALLDLGEYDEALAAFDRGLALRPGNPNCSYSRGLVLLTRGKFAEGWEAYESRRRVGRVTCARDFPQPLWTGGDLHDKRILIHTEQGLGDAIQFARYLPLVKQHGGQVLVQCHPPLRRLLEGQLAIDEIREDGQPLPGFDLHCPILSLPFAFRTIEQNIPANVPYLFANPRAVKQWHARVGEAGGMLKVGLVWAGGSAHRNDRNRSLTLAHFAPLFHIPWVRFLSLQKGEPGRQIQEVASPNLIDWTTELSDFADTAALVANLDLVICVDTAVAHLAGAMGKPVWVLLPFVPDWRWMLRREDSPWYPTMRLFRQEQLGRWDLPLGRVEAELRSLAGAYDERG
jgi:tetratricopeptide (TPR) repeat protein